MLRRRALLGGNLPYDAEVLYIQNTGTQWINTGYKPNGNTRIVCQMQHTANTQYGRLFGCTSGTEWNSTPLFQVDYEDNVTGNLRYMVGYETGWNIISSVNGDYNTHTYDFSVTSFKRDGVQVATHGAVTFQCTTNLAIFSLLYSNGIESGYNAYFVGKLYAFKIYESNVLVRDLIPVRIGNDGFLYDKVTKRFFGNSGSGNFSVGPDINKQYVDLGLPSGIIWSCCNVGANKETDYGNFYQYGKGARTFQETYGEAGYTGMENPLSLSLDAARQVMGEPWRMPSRTQIQELINGTTITLENNFRMSGHNGAMFVSKTNGNYMFIPAGGNYSESDGGYYSEGKTANIRACTPYDSANAWFLQLTPDFSGYVNFGIWVRATGWPTRGVYVP